MPLKKSNLFSSASTPSD